MGRHTHVQREVNRTLMLAMKEAEIAAVAAIGTYGERADVVMREAVHEWRTEQERERWECIDSETKETTVAPISEDEWRRSVTLPGVEGRGTKGNVE